MAEPALSFHEFERRDWGNVNVVAVYHDQFSTLTRQAVSAVLDAGCVGPGMRVLDVASGPGYAAGAAAERGAEVVGVDFSPAQLALAQRTYPAVEFREGDAGDLPFPNGSFDSVLSNFGMPHFPDPKGFIREAFRDLRSGGRVAFSTWAPPQEALAFEVVLSAEAHGRMDVSLPPEPRILSRLR